MSETNIAIVAVAFGVYTLAIVAVGLYSARYARRSDEDYFLAGRSLGGWIAALSASASSESGWVTLGLVGIGFSLGVQGYWVIPGCLLGYLFNWFVLAGRMNDQARRFGAVTLPDYFAFRFKERIPLIRILSVVVILAAMMAYVAAQMAAAGKTFEVLFKASETQDIAAVVEDAPASMPADPPTSATVEDASASMPTDQTTSAAVEDESEGVTWHYTLGVLLGAVIVLIYTVTGGFRAVCWTDFLQALLMVGALVLFPVYLLYTHGGYSYLTSTLESVSDAAEGLPAGYLLDPWAGLAGWALIGFLFGSHALGINFGYPGMPHVLARFMALRDRRETRLAGVVAFIWGLCVYWGAVTVGLFARAVSESEQGAGWTALLQTDKEIGLVVCSIYLLPGLLSGVVVAAVLAAICSTADSQLVVAASSAAYDLYGRVFKRTSKTGSMVVNRLVVLGLGIGAVLLVFESRVNVYGFVLKYGWAMLGAAFGPQVILAILWRRATYAGCLAGMLVGFVGTIFWGEWYQARNGVEIYNLPLAFMVALVVNIVVSLAWPGSKSATVEPAEVD
ncbi:MAG: sodium/proline symporter [Planctomycetota bacterium]